MNNMVLMEVVAEPSFWAKHLFDILTICIGLAFTIALYIWASSKKSHQLRMYIPTIWTSLGILFTFISIYKGLTDKELLTDVSKGQIENLIGRIIPAFSTSIIGIIGAIICSIINKGLLAGIEDKGTEAFNRLRKQMGFENELTADSPELLLFKIISAVNQNGNSIERILKTNQTTTTGKSDEIFGKFDELLNKLNDSTNEAIDVSMGIQNEEVRKEFDSLKTKMEGLNGVSNHTLENALKTQKSDFLTTIEKMEKAFEGTITTQNGIIENKLISLQSTLDTRIGEMKTTNEGLINRLIDVVQKDLANESEKRNQQLQAFIEKENGEIKQFIEKQEGLYQEIKGNLVNIVSDIRQLFEEDVQKSVEKFAQDQHRLSTTTIAEWNKNLTEKSNEYLKSFEDSIGKLPDAMAKKLDELHEKETELVKATISDNRTGVDTLLRENKQAIQDAIADLGTNLQESFEGIKNVIASSIKTNEENLAGLIGCYDASIKTVSAEIKTDNESIKNELVEAQKRWKESAEQCEMEHLEKVKKIIQDTAGEIQSIQTKITSIESALHASLDGIMNKVTESIGHFEEKQEEIKKFVLENNKGLQTDLTKQIHDAFQINELSMERDKLIEGINSTANNLRTQTKVILDNLSKVNEELKNNKDSLKESSDIYRDTVVKSNDLITYIHGTLNLIKSHLTQMNVIHSEINMLQTEAGTFQNALQELKKSIKEVEELKDGVAKKQTGKEKPNKQ